MSTFHVHTRLKGRLGNQLFQYWIGKWISVNTDRPLTLFSISEFFLDDKLFTNLGSYTMLKERPVIKRPNKTLYNSEAEETNDALIYNYSFPEDCDRQSIDPDTVIFDIIQKGQNKNVMVNSYNECYEYIKRHENWIKTLYATSATTKSCNNCLVIHLRLGDLSQHYNSYEIDYVNLAIEVIKAHENLPIIIVSEDSKDERSIRIFKELSKISNDVTLKETNKKSVLEDFEYLLRAKVILMTNSTFSWWAAYLNPFNPEVYVGLSSSRSPHYHTRESLFIDGPKGWHLYDMDNNTWTHNI